MVNVRNNAASRQTRRKLIEAAGELFAEKGLHATQIREITDRAGVNVAAVNYHFGDKLQLFEVALEQAHSAAATAMAEVPSSGPPEDRLRAFIHAFVRQTLDPDRPAWHFVLIWRKRTEPTTALDELIEKSFRPTSEQLRRILRELLPDASDRALALTGISIVGQCAFHLENLNIIRRLYSDVLEDLDSDALADYLTDFSLAAIRGMRGSAARAARSRRAAASRPKAKRARKSSPTRSVRK
ncbi:MAG: CerR family C-terminal domain-containing protein [Phycisphaerae bacterium]|nr:CerR family C-terminal domain-containing protein [Phycisphaerae bacterium]